jgi:hypothetical protein
MMTTRRPDGHLRSQGPRLHTRLVHNHQHVRRGATSTRMRAPPTHRNASSTVLRSSGPAWRGGNDDPR